MTRFRLLTYIDSKTKNSEEIMKYLTKKRNVELDVGDSGRGGRYAQMTNRDTDTLLWRQPALKKITLEKDRSATSTACDDNSWTKIFSVEGGREWVRDLVLENNIDIDSCVMGSGGWGTHNVKLVRSMKQKKYSSVHQIDQIEWMVRDVTCLVCPSHV